MADISVSGGRVRTPLGSAPVLPLILLGTGLYLAWFGVHYFKHTRADGSTLWPSDPIKAVLQGKGSVQTASSTAAAETALDAASGNAGAVGNAAASGADTAAAGFRNAQQNQDSGKLLAANYGWSPAQNDTEWNALVKLWNQESGWNNLALNGKSGAFGIAQALGHGITGTAGKYGNQYPSKAANDGDPTAQIQWGLSYIAAVYGGPAAAWSKWQERQAQEGAGWY